MAKSGWAVIVSPAWREVSTQLCACASLRSHSVCGVSAGVEAWLAYWVAVTPLLVVMQTPLTFAALRFVSGWRELSLLYVLWLMLPLTSGAAIVTRAATSRAAGISAWLVRRRHVTPVTIVLFV